VVLEIVVIVGLEAAGAVVAGGIAGWREKKSHARVTGPGRGVFKALLAGVFHEISNSRQEN